MFGIFGKKEKQNTGLEAGGAPSEKDIERIFGNKGSFEVEQPDGSLKKVEPSELAKEWQRTQAENQKLAEQKLDDLKKASGQ